MKSNGETMGGMKVSFGDHTQSRGTEKATHSQWDEEGIARLMIPIYSLFDYIAVEQAIRVSEETE
jgi:hypothetical protein